MAYIFPLVNGQIFQDKIPIGKLCNSLKICIIDIIHYMKRMSQYHQHRNQHHMMYIYLFEVVSISHSLCQSHYMQYTIVE